MTHLLQKRHSSSLRKKTRQRKKSRGVVINWKVPKNYRKILTTWIADHSCKNLIVNYIAVCTPSLKCHLKFCSQFSLKVSWKVWSRTVSLRKLNSIYRSKKDVKLTFSKVTRPVTTSSNYALCLLYGTNWTDFPLYSSLWLVWRNMMKQKSSLKCSPSSHHSSSTSSANLNFAPRQAHLIHRIILTTRLGLYLKNLQISWLPCSQEVS